MLQRLINSVEERAEGWLVGKGRVRMVCGLVVMVVVVLVVWHMVENQNDVMNNILKKKKHIRLILLVFVVTNTLLRMQYVSPVVYIYILGNDCLTVTENFVKYKICSRC